MVKKLTSILLTVLSISMVGCATTEKAARRQLDYVSYSKFGFPPHPKDYPIDLFFEGEPQKNYKVIGQITGFVVHDYNFRPLLEEKIRQVGGDGAIDIEIGTGQRTSSSSGYHLNVFTNKFETVTNVGSYKVINLKGKVIKYDLPVSLEEIQSTWTEQDKYAFNLGRAASFGAFEAGLSKRTGRKMSSRATREEGYAEVFIPYKGSPERLPGLHQAFEFQYDEFLNPGKATVPKKLEAILSNLSLFSFDLGWACNLGVINAFFDELPELPRSERNKQGYPFTEYKDDPTDLEQLHWAFEWGYKYGKALLPKKD